MQAKRKLTALLLSLCMLLGMLPMTAFAAGVPAAPTNLKLEVTADGLKVSWDKPASTGGLDIFEYEVTLYGHFDGIAGGKTKVETKTVQRETTCTFTNTGNAEGVINPNYEVEVKAREGVSGTGDPDNLGNYHVTEWTDWSNASTVSLDWNEVTFNTTTNNYYTGVVDVRLPDSENKLYKEGITATGSPDVTQPDGTTSGNEKQAVTELLYQYFEKNKETVPELENVTVDDLTVEAVLDRVETSQEGDGNSWTPTINVTVNRYYTLRLVYNPEADSNNPDEKQIVNAVNLVNVSISMEMGLTPAFTAEVDSSDQDKYEVYLEQWSGSDGKSITSEESFNSKIPEDERITTFEEGVTYRYSVWVKAKEGYAISEEASVYLNGRPANKGYTLTNHDEPKRPDGSFLSGTFNSLFVMECVFDQLKVNGIEVTSANKDDILGDADGLGATVSYDPDTNTLTLNNATLTVSEGFAAIHALIPNLTIVLKGENQINGSGSTENGIYSNGNLTITGDGILKTEGTGFGLYGNTTITITGGADVNILVTFSSANAPQPYSAVRALRGLTVDGADLTAWNKGENGTVYGAPGISASLTAKNGADVRIVSTKYDAIPHSLAASGEGTKVLAFSESSDHYGIGADGVEGTITISDGATVTACGGKGAMKSKPDLTGYTNPYIKAGAYTDSATEVTDPANTDYHMNTFVEIKAGETPIDSFTYEINGESVTITGYTGSEGNVTIPSEIDGKPVTAIGERAFSHNNTLTSVAIPDSVTSIGVKAFYNCKSLSSVTFAEGSRLSSIGDSAFYLTWSLTSIEIPDGVTGIGKSAFYESGLENINIPAGVTTIGMGAFEDCLNLSGVTFEKDSKLTEIESGTFFGCVNLTSIEIPAGVTSIGIMAFYSCSDLTSVTFEEGSQLSSIRESAFYWCTGLTDITFTGNTAPKLEADNVFGKCAALTAIHVPCGADGYTAANGWPEDKVQHEHVWAEDWTSDGTHHWKACTAEGCAEKDQYGVHQIANGVCTVCKAEVETSGVQTYAVKVNGINVTSANASDILGDADGDGATAYYDPAANTLTLDNAQLTSSGFGAVWAREENFTLVLKGENQITGEGDFPHSAVYSHGAMTVKGNGSLTTSGTYFGLFGNNTITIEDGASVDLTVDFSSDEQDQPYAAVRAIGGLTVDGATLNAKNNATQDAGFGTPGINTDLTAINGAKVNISSVNDHGICGDVIVSGAGTVVNASSASGEHYGIFAGQEDIFGELGGDQKGIFTISDGAVVTASGGKGAMRWKPDLSGYTDPVVAAGDSAAAEEIIGDPAGTEYQNEKYVQVRSSLEPVEPTEPTDPTDPTTPTDPTEPTDPAKPEQQGKPSGQTESPQTGDSSDMALWIGLMLASCGGVLGMLFYRRKKAAAGK